ncbi:MAG: hypothetical protein JXX14_12630 [Deltaproteobacteria bacterium]|nr:hypothetical protein [Deltaproteobacteria bacterium]
MKDRMEICGSCGTIAPPGKYQCAQCHALFDSNRVEVSPPDNELSYARLIGNFVCRRCGENIAISHFTLEGFQCPVCNSQERFDWALWEDIVKYAHNVADLCGFDQPDATDTVFWQTFREREGEDVLRRFRAIGRNSAAYTITNRRPHLAQYNVDVSPGNPVCENCHLPLAIRVDDGTLVTQCGECGEFQEYELMSNIEDYLFLFACISPWHLAERSKDDSRPTLPVPDSPTPWWMVFQGPSVLRQKIDRTLRRLNEETARNNQRIERRKVAAHARHHRMKIRARKRAAVILLTVGVSTAAITSVVLHFLNF